MTSSSPDIFDLVASATMSLNELRDMFDSASSGNVSVEGWEAWYNPLTGRLNSHATLNTTDPIDPITGVGLLAYSSDGAILYASQYTNNFSSPVLGTCLGTTLFNPGGADEVMCIIYGWTVESSFYFAETLPVRFCV